MTLRAKLVVLVVGLTALVLGGLGLFLSRAFEGWSGEAADRALVERAEAVAARVELEHGELELEDDEEHGEALRDPAHPFRVLGPAGAELSSRAALPWPRPVEGQRGPSFEAVIEPSGRTWRVATVPLELRGKRGRSAPAVVQVAGAPSPFAALEGPFRRGLLAALAVALLAGGVVAAALAHASLAPLRRLTAEVDAIGAASLDRRIGAAGLDPELRGLAGAFNALLGRLEVAMRQERQLVARASHSLRTPVATIRSRAEVTLRRERDPAAYREALEEVGAAAAEASELIQALLRLSLLDEQGVAAAAAPVALAPLLEDARRLLAPRAGLAGVALEVEAAPGLSIRAAPEALRELVEALLDNALLYTPAGGRAGVRAAAAGGGAALTVWDTGPGIPLEERPRVFERFWRGPAASASGKPGSGLGLAIVKAIADAYGATVSLRDRAGGGLEVEVVFPR